jgi:hypothetical protein
VVERHIVLTTESQPGPVNRAAHLATLEYTQAPAPPQKAQAMLGPFPARRTVVAVVSFVAVVLAQVPVSAAQDADNATACADFFLPKTAIPDYGIANIFGACSGHGVCVPYFGDAEEELTEDELEAQANEHQFRCVCEEGWTGYSDFINTDGFDCHINIDVVKYLWIGNLVFCVLVYVLSFKGVVTRVRQHFERQRAQKAHRPERPQMNRAGSIDPGSAKSPNLSSRVLRKVTNAARTPNSKESQALWQNKALMTMFMSFGVMIPCNMAYALLKIFAEDQRVGHTWAATLLFAFTKVAFYCSVVLYQPALLSAVLSGVKVDENVLYWSNFFGKLAMGVSMVLSFAPCVTVVLGGADANPVLSRALWLVYACGVSMCFVCMYVCMYVSMHLGLFFVCLLYANKVNE